MNFFSFNIFLVSSTNSLGPTYSNAITFTETNSDQVHDPEPDSDQSHEPISQECKSKQQVLSSSTKNVKLALSIFHYLRINEELFSDFYYSNIEKGWYCKICSLSVQSISGPTSFVKKAGDFGDHPNRTISHHLSSSGHQNAVKTE